MLKHFRSDWSIFCEMKICYRLKEYDRVFSLFDNGGFSNHAGIYRLKIYSLAEELKYDELIEFLPEFETLFGFYSGVYEKVIDCFCEYNRIEEAVYFFDEMERPTENAFSKLSKACIRENDTETLRNITELFKRTDPQAINNTLAPSVLEGYIESKQTSKALHVLEQTGQYDLLLFNKIILGFVDEGNVTAAVQFISNMEEKYKITPDADSFLPVITCLLKNDKINDALKLFSLIDEHVLANSDSVKIYNLLLIKLFKLNQIDYIEKIISIMKANNILCRAKTLCILYCGFTDAKLSTQANFYLQELISLKFLKSKAETHGVALAKKGDHTILADLVRTHFQSDANKFV